MERIPSPHEGDLSWIWCARDGGGLEDLLKNRSFLSTFPHRSSLYLAGAGAGGRGPRAEYQTGYRLEVHPYNIYYWRRMNRFPIYGPLTVDGRRGGISLAERNIYVLLKDVLMGWQRYRQELPGLSSLLSDLPGHWSSLDACSCSSYFLLNLNVSRPRARRGKTKGGKNQQTPRFPGDNWLEKPIPLPGREGKQAQQLLSTLPGNFEGVLCIKI